VEIGLSQATTPYPGGRLQFRCMGVPSPVAAVGPGGATTLLGRDAEMAALRGVLDRPGSGMPAAAMIQAEAGIGKTTLLDMIAAVAAGEGWRCWAVRGVEAESVLTFAGLLAIAQPLHVYAHAYRRVQAVDRPTLVVVDDIQWVSLNLVSRTWRVASRHLHWNWWRRRQPEPAGTTNEHDSSTKLQRHGQT
jgi:hypothetical protein